MSPASPDSAGDALVRAFAAHGFQVTLDTPTSLTLRQPLVSAPVDITEWRELASTIPATELPEKAAVFAQGVLRDIREKKWGGLDASSVLARLDEQSDIGRLVAEDRLRVRLLPENERDTRPNLHELVTRPLAAGLLQAVVVNYPDSAMMLNRSSLGDISENEVFGAALRTSIDTEPSDLHATEVWHVPITQIGGAQWYVGAHAHVLRRYLSTARYGALVSFPIPECMLVHEIGARIFVISAMNSMQALTQYHIADRGKALSPRVFWWQPGVYEQMPEDTAFDSGTVPELQPVEIETDHEARTTRLCTRATEELVDLWTRELLAQWRRRPDRA